MVHSTFPKRHFALPSVLFAVHVLLHRIPNAPLPLVTEPLYNLSRFDVLLPLPSSVLLLDLAILNNATVDVYEVAVECLPDFPDRYPHLKFVLFENRTDYYVLKTEPRTALPRSLFSSTLQLDNHTVHVPSSVEAYRLFVSSGRLLDCQNLTVHHEDDKRLIPLNFLDKVVTLRDLFYSQLKIPFMFGGTLLGWYRECTIIPHTPDLDFGLDHRLFETSLLEDMELYTDFRLFWMFGTPTDGLELTLSLDYIKVDFFLVFPYNVTHTYVGGLDPSSHRRFKWLYPRIDSLCAADLLGRLFHVPCNVEEVLEMNYTKNWTIDAPSKTYDWQKSHNNIEPNGRWDKRMWHRAFKMFRHPRWT